MASSTAKTSPRPFRFAGAEPVPDEHGGVARPGEVRDYTTLPGYGPWEPVEVPKPDGAAEAAKAAEPASAGAGGGE